MAKNDAHDFIAKTDLADTKKNVAYALTHLDGVTPALAVKLARRGITPTSLKDLGLDSLTLHYGLTPQEADRVQKGAQKGLPEGVESKLDFVAVSANEEEEGDDGEETSRKTTKKGK